MLQEGASPEANIYSRVTKDQLEEWSNNLKEWRYKWNASFEEPSDVINSIFSYTLKNNWKDLAYIMLEVSKLPMFDAVKVCNYLFYRKWEFF